MTKQSKVPDANPKQGNIDAPEERKSPVAKRADCIAAMKALSESELRRLRSYAASMEFVLRGLRYYADADDLLHEAIARTLDGIRKWKPQRVDLPMHLKGCMRSIADEYDEKGRRHSEKPLEEVPSEDEPGLYRRVLLKKASLFLKSDAVAFEVFNLLLCGHTAGTVRSILDIDGKTYNAARKRMIRNLRARLTG